MAFHALIITLSGNSLMIAQNGFTALTHRLTPTGSRMPGVERFTLRLDHQASEQTA